MNSISAQQTHSTGVTAFSSAVAVASVFGFDASLPWVLFLVVTAIAFIGLPHGALDHWTGRKLLSAHLGSLWSLAFFGSYLAVALIVVVGWLTLPLLTAVGFFIVSAWHFGMEDERDGLGPAPVRHLIGLAMGGLVIWMPALLQPERMADILHAVVPSEMFSVAAIISVTQAIALCTVPLAVCVVVHDLSKGETSRSLRNAAFAGLFWVADPLISFAVYFCGWHSLRGLSALAKSHRLSPAELALAVAPMTLGAVALSLAGWWLLQSGMGGSESTIRALFISLSAIAVPHLLLHGPITEWQRSVGVARSSTAIPEVGR